MTSVVKAASKNPVSRRMSDKVRIQAGHMLTYDELAGHGDMAERHIMQRVLRNNITKNMGMMALPLTLLYSIVYCVSLILHEDITNVFLLESRLRGHADTMFKDVESIDQLWDALTGPFVTTFFVQTDNYGNALNKSLGDGDNWGTWGRVDTYSQLQAAVRFTTSRKSLESYGLTPYNCTSNLTCSLCSRGTGFQRKGARVQDDYDCSGGDGSRRLKLQRPELDGSLPQADPDLDNRFVFYLYPSESQEHIREILNYYKERHWLDEKTTNMDVRMYLLNCELGRCRLEQFTMSFAFSGGGGIYYKKELHVMFLIFWAGIANIGSDVVWLCLLLLTTGFRARLAWKAFIQSELFEHTMDMYNVLEWIIICWGWYNLYAWVRIEYIGANIDSALNDVRQLGWGLQFGDEAPLGDMFEKISKSADELSGLRLNMYYYVILLTFRFMPTFGAMPRLAVLTKTMKAVLTDMIHFALVFVPIFMAYVVSGTLMFGRKFDGFATIQASFGTCFRISMESEYDWAAWTEDDYWYIGIWTWSFILIVVLLMLNMVLAIILDVYNEVREVSRSKFAEPIWDTAYNLCLRLIYVRHWVHERKLEASLRDGEDGSIIKLDDLKEKFPNIPKAETDNLYFDCKRDMEAAAEQDLGKDSLMQAAGSMMLSIKKVNGMVRRVTEEDAKEPLHSWISPEIRHTTASSSIEHAAFSTFMTLQVHSKGAPVARILGPSSGDVDGEAEAEELNEGWRLEGLCNSNADGACTAVNSDAALDDAPADGDAPAAAPGDAADRSAAPGITAASGEGDGPSAATGITRSSVDGPVPGWLQDVQNLLAEQRLWLEHAQWQLKQMQWQIQVSHISRSPSAKTWGPL